MNEFDDAYKKKLFVRWNKLSKELTRFVLELDSDSARPILEEIGFILGSYPNIEEFLLEYEMYMSSKEKSKKSVDKQLKERQNNVISIFDFKSRKSDKEE
jgi:hypothetical protein